MEARFLGFITASPDPPGIDLARWIALVAEHPQLLAPPDRIGKNPFTRKAMVYRAHPSSAHVVIDGAVVGAMYWALDGSHQIVVDGDADLVRPIAFEIAARLGGVYREEDSTDGR